jgi:hypothetical protein
MVAGGGQAGVGLRSSLLASHFRRPGPGRRDDQVKGQRLGGVATHRPGPTGGVYTGKLWRYASWPEGYVFSDPSRSDRFVFVDQATEDIDPENAWHLG